MNTDTTTHTPTGPVGLHPSSVVVVKPSFGLLAKVIRNDHISLNDVRTVPRLAKRLFIHRLRNRKIHVDADEIHQLKRSHFEIPLETYDPVDVFDGGDPLPEDSQRFAVKRPCAAI